MQCKYLDEMDEQFDITDADAVDAILSFRALAKNLGDTHLMFPRSFASLWMTNRIVIPSLQKPLLLLSCESHTEFSS